MRNQDCTTYYIINWFIMCVIMRFITFLNRYFYSSDLRDYIIILFFKLD